MIKLVAIRHGKTDWNNLGIIQGLTETSLNKEGIEQTKELINKLDIDSFDICLCSPMKRTRETVDILVKDKSKIVYDDLLVERCFGSLEGTKLDMDNFVKQWDFKLNDKDNGIESIRDLLSRAEKFLNKIKKEYQNKKILVVSHSCFIKALHFCITGYNENTDFLSLHIKSSVIYEYDII